MLEIIHSIHWSTWFLFITVPMIVFAFVERRKAQRAEIIRKIKEKRINNFVVNNIERALWGHEPPYENKTEELKEMSKYSKLLSIPATIDNFGETKYAQKKIMKIKIAGHEEFTVKENDFINLPPLDQISKKEINNELKSTYGVAWKP